MAMIQAWHFVGDTLRRAVETRKADDLQRRIYAAAALTGLLAYSAESDKASFARCAFLMADAMLIEQKKWEAK
jgi:hypothetical protein